MKLITANGLNRLWKTGILPALTNKFDKAKILTTTEQVTANTSNENVASAPVVKSLINDLAHRPDFIIDPTTGKITGYKTQEGGAGTVFPFISKIEIPRLVVNSVSGTASYFGMSKLTLDVKECSNLTIESFSILGSTLSYLRVYGSNNASIGTQIFHTGNSSNKNMLVNISDYAYITLELYGQLGAGMSNYLAANNIVLQ